MKEDIKDNHELWEVTKSTFQMQQSKTKSPVPLISIATLHSEILDNNKALKI